MTVAKILPKMTFGVAILDLAAFGIGSASAGPGPDCTGLPDHATLTTALQATAPNSGVNGGFNLNMWATVVNRDGQVCALTMTGADRGDQWPGSRVISAQKANTANSFSLPGLALSTGNLFSAVQPGGSLFGLQHSNPVDTAVAYGAPSSQSQGGAEDYGTMDDPLTGRFIGGVNLFGGGLALYDSGGTLLGALGVSGDTSCTDHNVAWRTRDGLGLDYVPGGVGVPGDNINYDIAPDADGHPVSAGGFGHPICGFGADAVNEAIVEACMIGDGTSADCTAL